ncbi:hypothetical protein AGLY_017426 [Aphis glycines]|uniref:MADF domain-containing protein n=1 Tax=Aphis glycines TaxID=307491 RepID=A0A6G0SUW2_APHGL|nr:hypothetical protein AGLY_017426 [Aphis glycines]
MANRWSEETTLQFVQLYRGHENLWNMFIPEYRNHDARSSSMEAIASELNLTIKEVSKKIKALRSTYNLELAKIEKSKASGSGTNHVYKPLLPWFDDMNHIMKTATVKEKQTYSNFGTITQDTLTQDTIHEQDDEDVPEDDSTNAREPLYPCQKRKLDAITDAVHELKNLNETMNTTKTAIQDDECDIMGKLMGKHIAIQLRELPSYDRVLANFELQKVLMNYRLKNMRGVSSSTSYSRPSSVASNFQFHPYTPQTTTSEGSSSRPSSVASTTADIVHAAMINSDINSDFFGSDVQYLN